MVCLSRRVIWTAFVLLSLYSLATLRVAIEEVMGGANSPSEKKEDRIVKRSAAVFSILLLGACTSVLVHWLIVLC